MKNTIKSRLHHAFTIVELVVVIAVIAALAAVLIPTFANVINSANESKDVSMIYNINLALATERDIETPEQALDIAAENGYNIENLTPSSDGDIVYDELTTSFALVSDGEVIYPTSNSDIDLNAPTTWHFISVNDLDSTNTITASYSVIITDATASTSSVDAKTSVKSVKTATAESTNGSSVVINYIGMGGVDTSRAKDVVTTVNYTYSEVSGYESNVVLNVYAPEISITISSTVDTLTIKNYGTEDSLITTTTSAGVSVGTLAIDDYNGAVYVDSGIVTVTSKGTTAHTLITTEMYENVSYSDGVLQFGTENYPYIATSENIYTLLDSLSDINGTSVYIKLGENITLDQTNAPDNSSIVLLIDSPITELNIDLNGKTLDSTKQIQVVNRIYTYLTEENCYELIGEEYSEKYSSYLGYSVGFYNAPLTVNISNGKIDCSYKYSNLRFETGCTATISNVTFTNSSTSTTANTAAQFHFDDADEPAVGNITFENCNFVNSYVEFSSDSGSTYEVNSTFINCNFSGSLGNGGACVKYNHYIYGTALFDGCTFTITASGNSPAAISTQTSSSAGGNKLYITITNTKFVGTSTYISVYSNYIPSVVSYNSTYVVINDDGTNSYKIDGTPVDYNSKEIE